MALVRSIRDPQQYWYADEYKAVSGYHGDGPRVSVWIANGPGSIGIRSSHTLEVSPDEGNLSPECRLEIWNALEPVLRRRDEATRSAVGNSLR
jgi:hypothetical protein